MIPFGVRLWASRLRERVPHWVARHLPRSVQMWAYVTVAADVTSRDPLQHKPVPEIGMMEALEQFEVGRQWIARPPNTGVRAAQLIAHTSKKLGDIARADECGSIDQFGMALAAYEIITGDEWATT